MEQSVIDVANPLFCENTPYAAVRFRTIHALHELQREKTMRGVLYPAEVASGRLKRDAMIARNDALDDAISLLKALTTRTDVLKAVTVLLGDRVPS